MADTETHHIEVVEIGLAAFAQGKTRGLGDKVRKQMLVAAVLNPNAATITFAVDRDRTTTYPQRTMYSLSRPENGRRLQQAASFGGVFSLTGEGMDFANVARGQFQSIMAGFRMLMDRMTESRQGKVSFERVDVGDTLITPSLKETPVSLNEHGFVWATCCMPLLRGFVGMQKNDPRIFFLPIDVAKQGHFAMRHWTVSNKLEFVPVSMPTNFLALNVDAVPVVVRTDGDATGLVMYDLREIVAGKIERSKNPSGEPLPIMHHDGVYIHVLSSTVAGRGTRLCVNNTIHIMPVPRFAEAVAVFKREYQAART